MNVKAYVVPKQGFELDEEEVKQYCIERMAPYKHPRYVEFVETLPKTLSGKVKKFKLVEESQKISQER